MKSHKGSANPVGRDPAALPEKVRVTEALEASLSSSLLHRRGGWRRAGAVGLHRRTVRHSPKIVPELSSACVALSSFPA